MASHLLLLTNVLVVHLVCLQMASGAGWGSGANRTARHHPPPRDGNQHVLDASAIGPIDHGFERPPRRRVSGGVRAPLNYGGFNSDTRGCDGIQTKSCNSHAQCTGCLGLYNCNMTLGKCHLKGLSQMQDKFLWSLKSFSSRP